ncbi:MAG: hypothetical protein AAGI48_00320 [Verrucomicrobiota bacterium]
MLLLLPALAILGCDQTEQVGYPPSGGGNQKLTELSVEELADLTEERRAALGDDYANADFTDYDVAISAHGSVYKRRLIKRIKESEHIAMTEHSDRMDFVDESGNLPEDFPFYEYRQVTLTEDQRSGFLSAVEEMDKDTASGSSMCIFEPHHRLEFIGDEEARSTLSICFQCAQVRWNEVNLVHPEGLFETLYSLIDQVGLQADKDWRTLAKQRSEQGAAGQPATPPRVGD